MSLSVRNFTCGLLDRITEESSEGSGHLQGDDWYLDNPDNSGVCVHDLDHSTPMHRGELGRMPDRKAHTVLVDAWV